MSDAICLRVWRLSATSSEMRATYRGGGWVDMTGVYGVMQWYVGGLDLHAAVIFCINPPPYSLLPPA